MADGEGLVFWEREQGREMEFNAIVGYLEWLTHEEPDITVEEVTQRIRGRLHWHLRIMRALG